MLVVSNKLNCFIKQAGLFNCHLTFMRNYPATVERGSPREDPPNDAEIVADGNCTTLSAED